MATDHSNSHSKPYVPDQVPVLATVKWMGLLLILILVVIAVARAMFPASSVHTWSRYTGGNTAPFSARQAPPNGRPRLQIDEAADLETYRLQQHQLLYNYAWIDKSAGTVRIPIERAMQRVLDKGFPVRKEAK